MPKIFNTFSALTSAKNSRFYHHSHAWIDLDSGKCGLTNYALRVPNYNPKRFMPYALREIATGGSLGIIILEPTKKPESTQPIYYIKPIVSPVGGKIVGVNSAPLHEVVDFNSHWLFELIDVKVHPSQLMTHNEYFAECEKLD